MYEGMRKEGIPGPHQSLEYRLRPLPEVVDLVYDRGGQVIQFVEVRTPHMPVRPLVSRVQNPTAPDTSRHNYL